MNLLDKILLYSVLSIFITCIITGIYLQEKAYTYETRITSLNEYTDEYKNFVNKFPNRIFLNAMGYKIK